VTEQRPRTARASDYPAIAAAVDDWWGRPVMGSLPRLFLDHFHRTSLVVDGPGAGRSAEGHVVMDMNIVTGGPFWRRLSAVTASPRSATYS